MNGNLRLGLVLLIQFVGTQALIIPDELPSILSIIYSNIPTLKKGTDSRYGWGFRLGDRADFQVLTELGPQQYTQKLANQKDEDENTFKRETLENLSNVLYAQRQQQKQNKDILEAQGSKKVENSLKKDTQSSQWLESWSKEVNSGEKIETPGLSLNAKPGLGVGEIDAKSVLPDDAELERIENLERMKTNLKKLLKKMRNEDIK